MNLHLLVIRRLMRRGLIPLRPARATLPALTSPRRRPLGIRATAPIRTWAPFLT
jgi:hypothetical protein